MMDVYSARELASTGLTKSAIAREVSRGRLRRIRRGWYATDLANSDVVAAVAAGGRLACVSALKNWGAWTMPHSDVHIRISRGVTPAAGPGRRLHWTDDRLDRAQLVDSLATALSLALRCLDLRALVVVVDSVLNQRLMPETVVASILATAPRGRRVAGLCDRRAESGIETIARLALRARRLPVRAQVFIEGVGRVDLLIGQRLVLEVDGRAFHHDFEADRARDRTLTALGYLVIRASYRQVMDDWGTIEGQILTIVRRRDHLWRRTLPQGRR